MELQVQCPWHKPPGNTVLLDNEHIYFGEHVITSAWLERNMRPTESISNISIFYWHFLFGKEPDSTALAFRPDVTVRCTMAWPNFLFPSPTVSSWTWLLVWKNGLPSPERAYVFNGDFVDRGKDSVEILMVLFAFMLVYPKEFHLNRGNHEDHIVNLRYKPKHAWGFGLYWLWLWSYFSRASYLLDAFLKQSSNL